jgi:hypothetical protein
MDDELGEIARLVRALLMVAIFATVAAFVLGFISGSIERYC